MLSLICAAATTAWAMFAEGAVIGATAYAIGKGIVENDG